MSLRYRQKLDYYITLVGSQISHLISLSSYHINRPQMSFASAFRIPACGAVRASTRRVGAQARASAFRGFSTQAPPPPKQHFGLYAGLGAVAVGGVAYYLLNSSSDSSTSKSTVVQATKFVPTKADYEKVCGRLME